MGVERAVTRWYVQRQLLLDEIATLETQVASSSADGDATPSHLDDNVVQKLAQVQEKLRVLGPCPKPMMG